MQNAMKIFSTQARAREKDIYHLHIYSMSKKIPHGSRSRKWTRKLLKHGSQRVSQDGFHAIKRIGKSFTPKMNW